MKQERKLVLSEGCAPCCSYLGSLCVYVQAHTSTAEGSSVVSHRAWMDLSFTCTFCLRRHPMLPPFLLVRASTDFLFFVACCCLSWPFRFVLFVLSRAQHPGTVRYHHVRRYQPNHLQKRAQLAQRPDTGLRAHPDRVVRKQGAHLRDCA